MNYLLVNLFPINFLSSQLNYRELKTPLYLNLQHYWIQLLIKLKLITCLCVCVIIRNALIEPLFAVGQNWGQIEKAMLILALYHFR